MHLPTSLLITFLVFLSTTQARPPRPSPVPSGALPPARRPAQTQGTAGSLPLSQQGKGTSVALSPLEPQVGGTGSEPSPGTTRPKPLSQYDASSAPTQGINRAKPLSEYDASDTAPSPGINRAKPLDQYQDPGS
ncbi:Hypothetical protein D9617_1g084510 [Elsinoe fawcettii]|nr:Hypothetical protein D9617_1g084510 [Elsinoe fawcettii]